MLSQENYQPPATEPGREVGARRRCDNCGKFFQISRKGQRFHATKCRREFHRHGAAFGPLRELLPKWIAKEIKRQLIFHPAHNLTTEDVAIIKRIVARALARESQLNAPIAADAHAADTRRVVA